MTKVLVVDDNAQNRYMAEVLLKGQGYQVTLATNGSEALAEARRDPPELIIADILMPVMDGFALCREWRMDQRLKSIPFVFYTATYTEPEDEKFALSLGADRFIVKPVDPESLVSIIREVLEKHVASGQLPLHEAIEKEEVYLKQYNQALIHKLEEKLVQLENTNQNLEKEIRERKLAEEKMRSMECQLVQSQKMEAIGTLAGGIAHDFNNFLAAIIGYGELALTDSREGESGEKHLMEMLKASRRAKDLVNQILTFSQQAGIHREPIQVNKIVRDVINLYASTLSPEVIIKMHLESEAWIVANQTQIYQVIMNLCSNASYAMKESGGIISISLKDVEMDEGFCARHHDAVPGKYLKLTVSDRGMGMTPDQLDRIFEPYYTTKEKGQGTGLGLSVVHGIVKDTGGIITVHSAPRDGSRFELYFPAYSGVNADTCATGDVPAEGRERILFVDDEPTLVQIGCEFLKKLGYSVTAVPNGLEALEMLKAHPDDYDLVITDMTMPGMAGDRLAQAMVAVRPDLPVILCTGFSRTISEEKAREMGIRAFLMKPFVFKDLAELIRRVLDGNADVVSIVASHGF